MAGAPTDPPPPSADQRIPAGWQAGAAPVACEKAPQIRQTTVQAGLLRRLGAGLIDSVLGFLLVSIAVAIAFPEYGTIDQPTVAEQERAGLGVLIGVSIWLNYLVICEWRWGRTAGKAALGISVVSADDRQVSWNRALGRNLMRVPDLIAIFFTVPGDERQQRLGDRTAKTMVVRGRRADHALADALPDGSASTAPPSAAPANGPAGYGAPWSAWEPRDALIGIGLVFLGLILVGAIAIGLVEGEPESTLTALFAQGVVFVAVPLLVASRRTSSSPWRVVGFNAFKASDLWLVAGAMVAQIAVTIVVSALLFTPEQDSIIEDVNFDETTVAAISAFIAIVIVSPVAEEALFRGLLFGAIRSRTPFIVAAVISGLLFGAVHLTTGDFAVAGLLAFFGVLLAWLYEKTGSLGPPIALHAVNNAIAITPLLL